MLAKITKDGVLSIFPTNSTEQYALQKWYEFWPDMGSALKVNVNDEPFFDDCCGREMPEEGK